VYRQYVPGCGYQNRRDYRAAMEKWLATIDADLFVTLSFAQDARLGSARQLLRQWFARLDNHYLGRGWARRSSDERTFAAVTALLIALGARLRAALYRESGLVRRPSNPSGQTAEYGDVIRLAQSLSLRAIERLAELIESEDERVAAVACNAILDRAFGKPQPHRPEQDSIAERLALMTPDERAANAVALVARIRARLAACRAIEHAPEE
jgi:hypothetical protein